MEIQKNKIEFYDVLIRNRCGTISVEKLINKDQLFCKFINNPQSDFVNLHKSFGFIVDISGEFTKFKVSGSFSQCDALDVWGQIELKRIN